MTIDLVGPRQRWLAMGLNAFAGYLAVAVAALVSGEVAARYGLRPEPYYLGVAAFALGLALTLTLVRDTTSHVRHEIEIREQGAQHPAVTKSLSSFDIFARGTWRDRSLSTASQAGLLNNPNDGIAWGLFPLFFTGAGLSLRQIAVIAFIYPATWGVCQLGTGALSDQWGRKWLTVGGMLLQGAALVSIALIGSFVGWLVSAGLLGWEPRWSIQHSSQPSAMQGTPRGAGRRSEATDSGETRANDRRSARRHCGGSLGNGCGDNNNRTSDCGSRRSCRGANA